MRGAFGKPQGTVARVNIGQVIMSVRSKEQHFPHCHEALRRAKFKFPGRQKVRIFWDLICSMITGLSSIILSLMVPLVLLCLKSEVYILYVHHRWYKLV